MLFSSIESIAHNLNRQKQNLRFFEFGKTYKKSGDKWSESSRLSIAVTGDRNANHWSTPQEQIGFFFLKAVVVHVLSKLGINGYSMEVVSNPIFSEGLAYSIKNKPLVEFGVVSDKILSHFDIKQEVIYAEFDWDLIINKASENDIKYKAVPRYPEVKRDFALLLADDVSFEQVRSIAFKSEKKLLKQVDLFDVYRGDKLPSGKKSYAVSFIIQDESKTLTDKQIEKIMGKLQKAYESELSAELR